MELIQHDYIQVDINAIKPYENNARLHSSIQINQIMQSINNDKVANTLSTRPHFHPTIPRTLNVKEMSLIGSYPLDYKFSGHKPIFYIGMSVPPLMIANIAYQIKIQWLDFIPKAI